MQKVILRFLLYNKVQIILIDEPLLKIYLNINFKQFHLSFDDVNPLKFLCYL